MAHQNVAAYKDKIYCRLPEGMEGFGGYLPDILVDNLSEREINLFICKVCHGIKRESCFREHEERADSLVNTEEIRQEIGNIKVSCPLNQCGWIGKLSEFEVHIDHCVDVEILVDQLDKIKVVQLSLIKLISMLCSLSCVCWIVAIIIIYLIINNAQSSYIELHTYVLAMNEDLKTAESNVHILDDRSVIHRLRLDHFERNLIDFQDKITQFGQNSDKSTENSNIISKFIDSFRELHDSYQRIRLNPYSPQKGVIWNIYQVGIMLEKPTELSGPEFYVNEYKFQPTIDTLRDGETCVTFCIALVNCNHYDKVKWPMELEERGFRVFPHSHKHSSDTLNFEINEDNKNKFEKPINEKNKPLCKQWLCKRQLMKYVENDTLTMYILNANTTQPDST